MNKILISAAVTFVLLWYIDRARDDKSLTQMANRLCEFFDEPDLSLAIRDYYSIAEMHASPQHAFETVLSKGGFTYD